MKFKMKIENPDDVEVTLNITMKMKDWRELRNQLQNCYPSWKLSDSINDMVRCLQSSVFKNTEDEPNE